MLELHVAFLSLFYVDSLSMGVEDDFIIPESDVALSAFVFFFKLQWCPFKLRELSL